MPHPWSTRLSRSTTPATDCLESRSWQGQCCVDEPADGVMTVRRADGFMSAPTVHSPQGYARRPSTRIDSNRGPRVSSSASFSRDSQLMKNKGVLEVRNGHRSIVLPCTGVNDQSSAVADTLATTEPTPLTKVPSRRPRPRSRFRRPRRRSVTRRSRRDRKRSTWRSSDWGSLSGPTGRTPTRTTRRSGSSDCVSLPQLAARRCDMPRARRVARGMSHHGGRQSR